MIRIAVCDDDNEFLVKTMRLLLTRAIKASGVQADVTFYSDSEKLLNDFEHEKEFDVIILDIDMPKLNGKELAQKLKSIDSEVSVAFMSAYKNEVYSVIPIGIDAFIPKDFDREKSVNSLAELLRNYEKREPQYELFNVTVDDKPATVKISIKDIYYFMFTGKAVVLHTYTECFTLDEKTLERAANKFLERGFFKVNRRCIINISKVYEVLENEVIMQNDERLSISRRGRKSLLKEMAGYLIRNG